MDNQRHTLQSVPMLPAANLHPTLWRTCRVLANRTRLKMLDLMIRKQPLTVSAVAEELDLPVPVASQYLRALEARGFLASRRVGRRVDYRPNPDATAPLVASLRTAFQRYSMPLETTFKIATAFTHPRRVEIYRSLAAMSRNREQLQAYARISGRALNRHLVKLESRGFIRQQKGVYEIVERADAFGKAIAKLALE